MLVPICGSTGARVAIYFGLEARKSKRVWAELPELKNASVRGVPIGMSLKVYVPFPHRLSHQLRFIAYHQPRRARSNRIKVSFGYILD